MSRAKLLGVVVSAMAVSVVAADLASAAQFPTPACNGGGCGGWFRSNVTVTWSYDPAGVASASGCGATTVSNDTTGQTMTCTLNLSGGGFMGNSVTVKKDSSPPSVKASFARGPDVEGWYTSPVAVSFSGDGGASGIASCTSGTYGGPDGADVKVSGSCTDGAGNVSMTDMPPQEEAHKIADLIAETDVRSVVINMEHAAFDQGLARLLAERLNAPCHTLEDLRADTLYRTVLDNLVTGG